MSDLAADHVGRQKRVFAPPPSLDATRLFERTGPMLVICVHPEKGFMIGDRGGKAVWSHDPPESLRLGTEHPDAFRTASSWQDADDARDQLRSVLSRAEWQDVALRNVRADVAEPPDTNGFANVVASPTALCSIEACQRAVGRFALCQYHRLDTRMRRITKPESETPRVSLARLESMAG